MTSLRFAIFTVAAFFILANASTSSAESVSSDEQSAILILHNSFRAEHCASPLEWSDKLAAAAQRWADKCWIGHDKKRGHVGENIAWGGDRSASSAVEAWYKEVEDYDYNKPGFASSTAHFTQMVWKDTKTIGCGVARCYLGTVRLWVCRYGPTGNWRGQYRRNVLKSCK